MAEKSVFSLLQCTHSFLVFLKLRFLTEISSLRNSFLNLHHSVLLIRHAFPIKFGSSSHGRKGSWAISAGVFVCDKTSQQLLLPSRQQRQKFVKETFIFVSLRALIYHYTAGQ